MKEVPLVTHASRLIHAVFGWLAAAVMLLLLFAAASFTGLFARDLRVHWHRWSKRWARLMLGAISVHVNVEDAARLDKSLGSGPVILACNHASMLDILVLLGMLPHSFGFLSKVEVFRIPLLGAAAELFGCIPIKRGDRTSAGEALEHAEAALREGRTVLIFPEGTRTRDGNLAHFKRGTMLLAQRTGVPVLPLAIEGSYELLPPHTWIGRPGAVSLRAGSLIQPPSTEEAVESASLVLHDEVARLLSLPAPPRPEPLAVPATNTI